MSDQLPQFTQGDWYVTVDVGTNVIRQKIGDHESEVDDYIASTWGGVDADRARLIAAAPKLYRALVALAAVAKVQSDAEYRAVLDARDVIAEVLGS